MTNLSRLWRRYLETSEVKETSRLALVLILALAMVLLGGASRDHGMNSVILSAIAVVLALPALFLFTFSGLSTLGKWLLVLVGVLLAWSSLSLIPVPLDLWAVLPGRADLAAGYRLLAEPPSVLAISVTPDETLRSLFGLLPALVLGALILPVMDRSRTRLVVLFLVTGLLFLVAVMGIIQYAGEGRALGYFYRFVNEGMPLGPFANTNHFSIFLIAGLPFIGALHAEIRKRDNSDDYAGPALVFALLTALLVVLGVALAQSFAGYLLLVPAVIFTMLIAFAGSRMNRVTGSAVLGLTLMVGLMMAGLYTSPILSGLIPSEYSGGVGSRQYAADLTLAAIGDHYWLGSGLGSYEETIGQKENVAVVTATFLPHAHNDYLQLAMETGLVGAFLGAALLGLIFFAISANVLAGRSGPASSAASMSLLILLAHSLVDYPLRTQSVMVLAIIALAILMRKRA
jgi:hypothetical protein